MKPSERLRKLRNERHMTQSQVARAIGVPAPTYASWECGGIPGTAERRRLVAGFYNVSACELFPGEDNLMHNDTDVAAQDRDKKWKGKHTSSPPSGLEPWDASRETYREYKLRVFPRYKEIYIRGDDTDGKKRDRESV